LKGIIKVSIGVISIPSALYPMLAPQVNPHPLIQKPLDPGQVMAAITIVKVTHPSPD
jgi:hypothetical protein